MSQHFPNPHEVGTATSGQRSSVSHPHSQNSATMTGIQGPAALPAYDQRQSLPAMPRTASAPSPYWPQQQQQQQQQQQGPAYPYASSSIPRSASHQQNNGYAMPQRVASQARPPMARPAVPSYPSYGPPAQRPRPTPYGIPQASMPNPHSHMNAQVGRPRPLPPPQYYSAGPQSHAGHPAQSAQQQQGYAARPSMPHPQSQGQPAAHDGSFRQEQAPARRQDSLDLEVAMQASQASARDEEERRRRQEQDDEQQVLAMSRREEEARRRREDEQEAQALQQALEASQREEEERRRAHELQREEEERHAQVLLEESRQHALREDEERIRREHADILARSKHEAMLEEQKRQQALQAEKEMEEAAIRESLREMEEEWRRREEAERAAQAFRAQGGAPGAPTYWQHIRQDAAYELAVDLERRASTMSASTVSTTRSNRRPLPPTPQMSTSMPQSEHFSPVSEQGSFVLQPVTTPLSDEDDLASLQLHPEADIAEHDADDSHDPFTDQAEAPPLYDEVHVDRPPAAPTTIPEHVQFAPPVSAASPDEVSPIVEVPAAIRDAKTPASASEHTSATRERDLPSIPDSTRDDADDDTAPIAGPSGTPSTVVSPRIVVEDADASVLRAIAVAAPLREPTELQPHPRALETVPEDGDVDPLDEAEEAVPTQRAMKSTEFGYASEPFSPELDPLGTFTTGRFPNLIKLRSDRGDGTLAEPSAYFVIRAPSWKALLRALAWYGNTRVEAGPEEVVDHPEGLCLHIEAEFITPTKASLANARKAFASVSISLLMPDSTDSAAVEAQATALKNASRALDASYVRQGSTRRVMALPRRPPKLPIDLVRLAQHMHEAHTFSAACPPGPSSGSLHSPRDLSYAVEKHDIRFVAKVQRLRRDEEAQLVRRTAGTEEFVAAGGTSAQRASMDRRRSGEGPDIPEEYEEMDAGAIDIVDAPPGESRISLSRMRERVRKHLARRSGDPRAQKSNEDLESWITPFDLSQHG